jgi:hypothetical protein
MRTNGLSFSKNGFALLVAFLASAASTVSAQTAQEVNANLQAILKPGMTVWITDTAGREEQSRILDVQGELVASTARDNVRRYRTGEVARVRVRHADSVLNGALIGAGAAVASGLFLCTLTEPWENCRDDVGPMVRIGALGAGIGIGIDALIRGRKTIYEAGQGSIRLHAAPVIAHGTRGLRLSLTF